MFENTINPVPQFRPLPAQSSPAARIIDIRSDKKDLELREALQQSIHAESTALPDLLLWDEQGLRLFEEVTYCPSYYLTGEEISVLEANRLQIASRIPSGSMLVELGSGNLRKTKILLDALEELNRRVDYFALDVSYSELARTLRPVTDGLYKHVHCYGLLGTYDDGRRWLQHPNLAARPKTIMFLGSTVGNTSRDEAADFLASFAGINCDILLGVDGCKNEREVLTAYNDPEGVNHRFVRNGLVRANKVLGREAFDLAVWDVKGDWDEEEGLHTQFYFPRRDVVVEGAGFPAGRRLIAARSHKYDAADRERLFKKAGLVPLEGWASDRGYSLTYLTSA